MRSFAVALAGLCSVAAATPSLPVSVKVEKAADKRGIRVDIRGLVNAPVATVEAVLRDFDGYPAWMPNVTAARSLPAGAFESTVHLPWPLSDVTELVRVQRTANHTSIDIAWRQIRGDLLRNEGHWVLIPRSPAATEVRYQANFQLRAWVPMFLIKMAQNNQGPKLIQNLRVRAASRS